MIKNVRTLRNVAFVLLSAFFLSCENPNELAFDVFNTNPLKTFYNDSLKVETATFLSDSVLTSSQSHILIGGYTDDVMGYITSNAYIQPILPLDLSSADVPVTIDANAIIDSIQLRLVTSQYMLGDTNTKIQVAVHRLTENMSTSRNYNFDDKLAYDPTPLQTFQLNIDNVLNASRDTFNVYRVNLPVSIGKEILALTKTTKSATTAEFIKNFKGFAFVVNGKPAGMYGFTVGASKTTMNLYYHLQGETASTAFLFDLANTSFSSTKQDRSRTNLASLTTKGQELTSAATNGVVYTQMATGVNAKITFSELSKIPAKSLVNKAELVVTIDSTINKGQLIPLSYLALGILGSNNKLQYDASNKAEYVKLTSVSTPIIGPYVNATKSYTINITPYIQDIVNGIKPNNPLALLPATVNSSSYPVITNNAFSRIAIKKIQLKLYYSTK